MDYKRIIESCESKMQELGIEFDFNNNAHMQYPHNLDDLFKNLVWHSQNRSQGCAINFFKFEKAGGEKKLLASDVWNCISNFQFNLKDNFSYLNLFSLLKDLQRVRPLLSLEKGKDIQFLELSKTSQCIKKYISQYGDLNGFVSDHKFETDARKNWSILKKVSINIYNMSTELVPDFFKEQDCFIGREFLVKADLHVKRFFSVLYDRDLNDKQVYEKMLYLYRESSWERKNEYPPYKLDKFIYLIGKKLADPERSKNFADSLR